MSQDTPVLHMLCGKIAAGKSTLATQLSAAPRTVLISEDAWLAALYGDQMKTLGDYLRCAGKLKEIIGPHVIALLQEGLSVVMDFPANRPVERAWLLGLATSAGVAHQLHHLDLSDERCKARLRVRNAKGTHPFAVSDAQFDQITAHFVAPTPEEGLTIVVHRSDDPAA